MNQYHIYEAIGRGKHSTVYKGRKKKSIEYYAVKSVDKAQKGKVLQEVRILHSLDHPNVLKFYSWYETSAHLWLVLEYCVGGDLMTLLQQDSRLPEDSIHDLARDLVRALQFLHSKGIIYCDLKPSNILLDENGRMKLCDFGLARRLSDISKSSVSSLPQAKRGTPCYMAPELFQDGGVHSYASDFWALGCVLYECYAGKPPFVGNEFTELVKSILSDPVPPLPDNPSKPFANLINCLLIKDPAERVQWVELCQHDFWRTKFNLVPLPPQPAFSSMLQQSAKPCLSERNGDKPLQDRTPPKYRMKDSKGIIKHDENSFKVVDGLDTPIRTASGGTKNQTKTVRRAVEEKQKDAVKCVNLLRLSRIAKSNLQRENDNENYRRPLSKGSDYNTDVKIIDNDMELDFNENAEEDIPDESDGSDNSPSTPAKNVIQNGGNNKQEKADDDSTPSNILAEGNSVIADNNNAMEQDTCAEHVEVAATPPGFGFQRRGQCVRTVSSSALDSDVSKSSNNLSTVFWHSSDLSVRPVMPAKKGDRTLEALPSLSIDACAACDFVKLSVDHLETLSNRIVFILSGNSAVSEKQNIIRYIEMLSSNVDAANILTNGPIMLVLVKMLRQSKNSILRAQLSSLIGSLIRYSTYIDTELSNSGIMGALADGLRDKQEKVRRFSMAALGELLFYISTQNENAKDGVPESPSKDNRSASSWQVSGSLISLISSTLRKGEDDVTQLYALRTIENICSQGRDWASRFSSQDVIGNLCYIYKAAGKQESTKLTAGSCLVRLARFSPPIIQSVMEKLSFKECTSSIIKGSPREQQICLNLLNMAMLGSHLFTNMGRHLLPLVEEKQLIPSLLSLIEQGTGALRGKVLVFVALLCKNSRRWLPYFFCNARLLSAVEKLLKEKDSYLLHCVEVFRQSVAANIPGLMEVISAEIQQIIGGKRHGQIASLAGRSNSKNTLHLLPVVLNLLGSFSFKSKVVSTQVLQQLANLIKLIESPFQGRDDLQTSLLQILESITVEPSFVLQDPKLFIGHILPSLAIIYKGNKDGDARFLCLKILFDVVVIVLENISDASCPGDQEWEGELKALSNTDFLSLYPLFIEDEDPIPMYAQKLLVMFIEFKYVRVSDILNLHMVSKCFEFLLDDFSNANVNNVKLCLSLASAPEMEAKLLSHLRVVRKIGNLLEFIIAKEMEDFLEPTLGLCKAFILHAMGSNAASDYSKDSLLLDVGSLHIGSYVDKPLIKDISDFGANVGLFVELSGNRERQVADLASDCLISLLKVAPREASMGLLLNLSKFYAALECLQCGASVLPLLRLLHALGYSCRQYLSQAMILSISITDVKRIEGIVSDLRTSSVSSIADASMEVFSDLQRLPRCL